MSIKVLKKLNSSLPLRNGYSPIMYKAHHFDATELRGETFDQQVFTQCVFTDTSLKLSNFVHCTFDTCDFSGVILELTGFDQCVFPGSKLSNLNFAEASFSACNFAGAIINDSIFQRFKSGSASLRQNLDLRSCQFTQADLAHSIFCRADLRHNDFTGANLTKTVFESCKLANTSFARAVTDGISFQNCVIDKTVLDLDGFLHFGQGQGFVID